MKKNKYNLLQLEKKVCVITGAASKRSIGFATAELFAAHGAKLVLLDIEINNEVAKDLKSELESTVGKEIELLCLQCDVRSKSSCNESIQKANSHFGTIDCLIHCAGIVKSGGMLSITEEDYTMIMDVNLKGTFNICKSVLQIFKEKKSGTIVNLSSLAAQKGGGLVGGTHYAASKGGVISLTRSIAREFAPMNIRANVICPAMIETPMLDGLTQDQLNKMTEEIPLKRLGKTSELAGACLFLASDLSGFVTGVTLDVNGGIQIQ